MKVCLRRVLGQAKWVAGLLRVIQYTNPLSGGSRLTSSLVPRSLSSSTIANWISHFALTEIT